MSRTIDPTSRKNVVSGRLSIWDLAAGLVVLSGVILFAWNGLELSLPYHFGASTDVTLNIKALPYYAFRSVMRMLIAMIISLVLTFVLGTWAAKSRSVERFLIPLIDILQSVPVLSYLMVSVYFFIRLFPHSMLGPECAAILAIVTSQVWNMILSFYQSLKTMPEDYHSLKHMMCMSRWRFFWSLEVPHAFPGLVWNMMLSMSAGWFFVVASEAISVAGDTIYLPGIGSFVSMAIAHADKTAILQALLAMVLVIFFYDQLIFRPLVYTIMRYNAEDVQHVPWVMLLFKRAHHVEACRKYLWRGVSSSVIRVFDRPSKPEKPSVRHQRYVWLWGVLGLMGLWQAKGAFLWIGDLPWHDTRDMFVLGCYTALRVFILIFLCALVWVPVGVWIGRRPRVSMWVQPMIQFLAAFPANLFYPMVVIMIVTYHLNPNIWTAPLMILGTQWYILFNVIAGVQMIPKDIRYATAHLHVKGWLWWKRFALPSIFPFLITGLMTAAGGAWNASIIAEAVSWGPDHVYAKGLGAYITQSSQQGNVGDLALATAMMCFFVVVINRVLWLPLYRLAVRRYRIN